MDMVCFLFKEVNYFRSKIKFALVDIKTVYLNLDEIDMTLNSFAVTTLLHCKTLILGGYFYLALLAVQIQICQNMRPRNTVSETGTQ